MVSGADDQTHLSPGCPSLGRGGKTIFSSSKKKEKAVASSKDGFDYLTCSQKEPEDRILRYASHHTKVPWYILGHKCTLDVLSQGVFFLSLYGTPLCSLPCPRQRTSLLPC